MPASGPYELPDLLEMAPVVASAAIRRVDLRKQDPTWRFALAANPTNPGLVLELRSADGLTGLGSACEIRHIGYDMAGMQEALGAVVAALKGDRRGLHAEAFNQLEGPARAILHTALLDLVAARKGVAAHALLGEQVRTSFPVTRIVSLKSPEKMAAVARELVGSGYRYLKVKLDNDSADVDVRRVAEIRNAVGPGVGISVDANQAYDVGGAIAVTGKLADYGVELFEQPVAASDITGLAAVRQKSPIPIEADESAASLASIRRLAEAGAVDGVSLKVAKLGGADRMLEAAQICEHTGMYVRIGAHVGSRILNAVALHAGSVLSQVKDPSELAEFERLLDDPASGLPIEDGWIRVPQSVGLGVTCDELGRDVDHAR